MKTNTIKNMKGISIPIYKSRNEYRCVYDDQDRLIRATRKITVDKNENDLEKIDIFYYDDGEIWIKKTEAYDGHNTYTSYYPDGTCHKSSGDYDEEIYYIPINKIPRIIKRGEAVTSDMILDLCDPDMKVDWEDWD